MKIAEIKEMTTNDLVERVEAETANYNQMVIILFLLWKILLKSNNYAGLLRV